MCRNDQECRTQKQKARAKKMCRVCVKKVRRRVHRCAFVLVQIAVPIIRVVSWGSAKDMESMEGGQKKRKDKKG